MKVDSKYIVPMLSTVKSLMGDFDYYFNEFEDIEQVQDAYCDLNKQIKDLLSHFKIEHLVPVLKQTEDKKIPFFVKATDKILTLKRFKIETPELTDNDDKMIFMTKVYIMVKKKLEYDGVEHLSEPDKMHHHIITYLIANDDEWDYYFRTELAECIYKVVDTIVEQIIELRRKAPQLKMNLEIPVDDKAEEKKLINLL